MERFVTDLLASADLSTLTKKSVREAYSKHSGQTLDPKLKKNINSLVDFLITESAAQGSPVKTTVGKENVSSEYPVVGQPNSRFKKHAVKGIQQKKENRKASPKKSPKKLSGQSCNSPEKKTEGKKKTRSPPMKMEDVMTAVLDSDGIESMSEENSDESSDEQDSDVDVKSKKVTSQANTLTKQKQAQRSRKNKEVKKKSKSVSSQGSKNARKKATVNYRDDISSDSDSEWETIVTGKKDKAVARRNETKITSLDSDSSNSDCDTPIKNRKIVKKKKRIHDSDSTVDTPVKGKSLKRKRIPDSDSNTDTPIKTGNSVKKTRITESDSDSDYLVNKTNARKKRKTQEGTAVAVSSESDSDTGTREVTDMERKAQGPVESDVSSPGFSPGKDQQSSISESRVRQNIGKSKVNISHHSDSSDSDSDSDFNVNNNNAIKSQSSVKKSAGGKSQKGERSSGSDLEQSSDSESDMASSSENSDTGEGSPDAKVKVKNKKIKQKSPPKSKPVSSSSSPKSDSDDDLVLARYKARPTAEAKPTTGKGKSKLKGKVVEEDSLSSADSDSKTNLVSQKTKLPSKTGKPKEQEQPRVKGLRKICQACGIILRNTIELKGCDSDKQKMARMKELLKKAGMDGNPSMAKVAGVRLRKEAAELDSGNIISTEPALGKRQVASKYSRRPPPGPRPSKVLTESPIRFGGLKGIVDSDSDEDD